MNLVSASESVLVDFFGVQCVACTFTREFDRKAPPSGAFQHFSYILHLQHCGVENIDASVNLA
jgi:hypothetical protein